MPAVAEMTKLDSLQAKLNALHSIRATQEKQKSQLNAMLEEIASRRGPLTKLLAQDDITAEKRLVDLESEASSIKRRLEGIELHLAANAAELQPLEVEIAKESAIVAAKKLQKQYEALCGETWARRARVEALEFELMCEHTALHENLVDLTVNFAQFNGGNVATKIYEGTQFHSNRVNENWRPSPKTFGNNPVLKIQPMLRPKR